MVLVAISADHHFRFDQCCQICQLVAIWATFEPFDDQYFASATLKFGYFLCHFSKLVWNLFKQVFLARFLGLWYFWEGKKEIVK